MLLKGKCINLRPMQEEEFTLFYTWAAHSQATPYWYGELYGSTVPSLEDFRQEWQRFYFDGSLPEKGRSFVIEFDCIPIGQINYNEINRSSQAVDIDIIIADESKQGKGYGSDAIRTLALYLFEQMEVECCILKVVNRNTRAIHAYEKIGFKQHEAYKENDIEWIKMILHKRQMLSEPAK